MVQSSEVGKHTIKTACVFCTDVIRLAQITLTLGRFLREDVATVGVAALVLAGGGLADTLGRCPVGLDLGHCYVLDGLLSLTGRWLRHTFRPCPCLATAHTPTGGRQVLDAANNNPGEPGRPLCQRIQPLAIASSRKRTTKRTQSGRVESPHPHRADRRSHAGLANHFFLGAIIMTICRPSRRGRDSITMSSPRSASIRLAISRPSS